MQKLQKKIILFVLSVILFFLIPHLVLAAPIDNMVLEIPNTYINAKGEEITCTIQVVVTGDEYYTHVKTLDGYTLIRDPEIMTICYANLDNNGELISSKIPYIGNGTSAMARNLLPKNIRERETIARQKEREGRKQLGDTDALNEVVAPSMSNMELQEIQASSTNPYYNSYYSGDIVGLTILINFPDVTSSHTKSNIEDFCNGLGSNDSVRKYFRDVSGGSVDYTNIVTEYYTAKYNRSYYTDPSISYGTRARELMREALEYLSANGFDFSGLSKDSSGRVRAVNILYAGSTANAWSEGLWPHKSSYATAIGGTQFYGYQITNMPASLNIGTFVHENGHLIFNWKDTYDTTVGSGGCVGRYDLMANSSASIPPNAYFRTVLAGWGTPTILNDTDPDTININSNQAGAHVLVRSNNREFYIIENVQATGRWANFSTSGLYIWHADEAKSSNTQNDMTYARHNYVSLVQADGLFHLERNTNIGDSKDAFYSGNKTEFTGATVPTSSWWDGLASGLNITNISTASPIMQYTYTLNSSPLAIQSLRVNSPGTGSYKAGQQLTLVVNYNEDIIGTAPTLNLKFGTGPERTATAGSVSGKAITYWYTIQAGDNGVLEVTNYSGGTITDTLGNAALPCTPANVGNTITADTIVPTVTNIKVTSPTSGSYASWEQITIQVTFSENITGAQLPTLVLGFGEGSERNVTSVSLSGATITYRYTLQPGDVGLLEIRGYNGGNVTDAAGNAAMLSAPANSGYEILSNITTTTVDSIKVTNPSTGAYKANQELTLVVTYNNNITGTAPTLKLKFGTGAERTITSGTLLGKTITYIYTVQEEDNGLLAITDYSDGSIIDIFGNEAVLRMLANSGNTITADTILPTISLSQNVSTPIETNVIVTASLNGTGSNIIGAKYMKGDKIIDDFANGTLGTTLTGFVVGEVATGTFNVSSNGTYTVYTKDQAGNEAVNTILISNITVSLPSIVLIQNPSEEAWADQVQITANLDGEGNDIVIAKYMSGNKEANDFANGTLGTTLTGFVAGETATGTFNVTSNGTYTVYAKNSGGYETTNTITISNIDATEPTIVVDGNPTQWQNKAVILAATITDTGSGVSIKKYAAGQQETAYFEGGTIGDDLELGNKITILINGWITIYAKDNVGNETSFQVQVTKIDMALPVITISPNGSTVSTSQNITITISHGASGLNESNVYEYQLGTSNTNVPTGTWNTYTSEVPFTIGTDLTGNYYLWVKAVSDNAGNTSVGKFPKYMVSEMFIFDNTIEPPIEPPIQPPVQPPVDSPVQPPSVAQTTIKSVSLIPPTKTTYNYNEKIDIKGGKVSITLSDGSKKVIPLTEDMLRTKYLPQQAGDHMVVVLYEGNLLSFEVALKETPKISTNPTTTNPPDNTATPEEPLDNATENETLEEDDTTIDLPSINEESTLEVPNENETTEKLNITLIIAVLAGTLVVVLIAGVIYFSKKDSKK